MKLDVGIQKTIDWWKMNIDPATLKKNRQMVLQIKNILVTGGTGMGKPLCRMLVEEGAKVQSFWIYREI